jgi:hypothetical protein
MFHGNVGDVGAGPYLACIVGGVGQKFPNDEKISEYFMTYEATKVFAIRKMKTQFTNKNTHILRTDVLQKHAVP